MGDMKSKFEAALAARQRQKAAEASRAAGGGGGGVDYSDIPYAALQTDRQRAFRFAGLPYSVREKSTDSKRIFIARILGDDDRQFRCIGPDPHEQPDWILHRVMRQVLARHWDKNLPGVGGKMGGYVYDNAKSHADIYTRVAKNNRGDNPYESGWRFSPSVLFNVIDREDYKWHVDNRKYRILSKKMSESNGRVYFDEGVPDTVYQQILDEIVAVDGNTNWEDYDIVIKKISEKPWYKVYHGVDDAKKIDAELRPLISTAGLTDEERSWAMNDFDALFPVTRYGRIKTKLGLFMQRVDAAFGSHYFDELCSLVDREERDDAARDGMAHPAMRGSPLPSGGAAASPNPPPAPAPRPEPAAAAAPRPAPSAVASPSAPAARPAQTATARKDGVEPMTDAIWAEIEGGSRLWRGKPFAGVSQMTAEEKAMVTGIRADNQFEWKPEAGELFEGARSGFLSPSMCHVDPASAQVFEDCPPF